jgi:glycerate 2-kinase
MNTPLSPRPGQPTAASPLADPAGFLRMLFNAAVARALPGEVTAAHLPHPPDRDGPQRGRTLVLGAGKAGGAMAAAVDALWPADAPLSGLVITRYDHVPPAYRAQPGRIEVVEARHPVPDEAGLQATRRIVALTQGLTEHDLVLCLISGGGSALLTLPAAGLSLADKQALNSALLKSGAAIDEMNTVRKHLSAIKGGRLAALCHPARVVTLAISDVPGDEPAIIASGPTVPDASTCADALHILARYGITVPEAAHAGLASGAFETPKPGDACFAGQTLALIATPQASLQAAADAARAAGIPAHILSDEIEGESRTVGQVHAALARAVAQHGAPFARPCVILSGGETTVTVRADGPQPAGRSGRGGRAGEFLLSAAIALQGRAGVYALAADTDGIDGIEHNAGALVTPDTLARAAALGLKPADSLDQHDAFSFFEALGDLVVSGPTFTNVNDFRALLVL